MNTYLQLKQKHQNEVNSFPMVFAFNQNQFNEAMQKLGLDPAETDKIYSIGGGGLIRKTDSESLNGMFTRHEKEMNEAINSDITGDGFIFDMFDYELGNHEYTYTGCITDAINSLGFSAEDINNNKQLLHGLNKACESQWEWYRKNG